MKKQVMTDIKPIKLENWSVIKTGHLYSPYVPPEFHKRCLCGTAIDHPKRPNKTRWDVKTSYIIRAEGKIIHTVSGSIYELGEIDPNYLAWMKENNIEYNPEQPIKIHGQDEQ